MIVFTPFNFFFTLKLNSLTRRRTQVSPFTEISILLLEGIIKKFPILGYIPKNDEKENLVHKGLNDFEKRGKRSTLRDILWKQANTILWALKTIHMVIHTYKYTCLVISSKINGTPKNVYLTISKQHSTLAVANLLAHNNISQICYCVKFHYKVLQLTAVFWQSDIFGVPFIFLAMVHNLCTCTACIVS